MFVGSYHSINVHAPFYNKVNEVLGLNTDDFYKSYKKDKELSARMSWLDNRFGDDVVYNVALASIIEGAILYSNFAFFKHFQAEGKNKLVNLCAGINFSVRDENIHSEAGAWLFKTPLSGRGIDKEKYREEITQTVSEVLAHETAIIRRLFSKGKILGITHEQMVHFVQARLDLCLNQLGYESIYKPKYDPISKWFYKNINSGQLHDFFHKQGNNYNRDWKEKGFVW